ncbi:MAG: 30S ribosomal protein S6--L-glutamate ligase [Candidatus Hydrogenedentales bacterium]|jgi:ribosomal protein S6--L-glutamate ligase
MKIGILSRQPRSYSTRRLREAAKRRGHSVRVLDTLRFAISLEKQEPNLYYRGRKLPALDAVIPRIGASITFYGLAVLRQFEQMGIYVASDSAAIARSRDKLCATQLFSRHSICIPATEFVRDSSDILPAIRRVGGVPVIIKVIEGTQGVGVILAETEKAAEAIIQTLHGARQNVLIQKFVKESHGSDLRAFVVGGRVVAAMRRVAKPGEYRSNVHRGASVEPVTLTPEFEHTALRAAQIVGLGVAGVDMLESAEGPQVMEVNSSPGLEGIEKATGIDIASTIVEFVEEQALFPDVDLRQQLCLSEGFGIAEFSVYGMPELEGKPLRDTPLASRSIYVLNIAHHNTVIPHPKADDVIQTGDVLLCYGDLRELRNMMPPRKRRKRPRKRSSPEKSKG